MNGMPVCIGDAECVSEIIAGGEHLCGFVVSYTERFPSHTGRFIGQILEFHDGIIVEDLAFFGEHIFASGIVGIEFLVAEGSHTVIGLGGYKGHTLDSAFAVVHKRFTFDGILDECAEGFGDFVLCGVKCAAECECFIGHDLVSDHFVGNDFFAGFAVFFHAYPEVNGVHQGRFPLE